MFSRTVFGAFVCALLVTHVVFSTQAHAQVIFDESGVVTKAGATVAVPVPLNFTVTAAGRYRITMSDVGPTAAVNAKLVVTRGMSVAARLDATGFVDVDLTEGSYVLRMSGRAPANSSSQLNAVVSLSGVQIAAHSVGLVPLAPTDPTFVNVQDAVHVATAGTYSIELSDRSFPSAISGLSAILTLNGAPMVCIPASPACANAGNSFIANPGEYQLNVIGTANAVTQAGLFSVRIADTANNQTAYAKTHAVGTLAGTGTTLQLVAQDTELSAMDHGFPVALAQLHLALVQGANVVALRNVGLTLTSTTLQATAGDAELYTYAMPVAGNTGNYGVLVRQGTQTILSDVRAASHTAPTSVASFNYQVNVSSAGAYQVRVHDFALPTFGSVRFAVTQNGELLEMADTASTLVVNAAVGVLDVAVVVTAPAGQAVVNGLFGITITRQTDGTRVWEKTQGVGGLFQSRTVGVTSAGQYQISFVDQRFPAPFNELVLVTTRGAALISSIYAAGGTTPTQTTIDATPGEYTVNLLAVASGADSYGLYGIKLENITAPAPSPTPAPPSGGNANAVESGGGGLGVELWLLALFAIARTTRRRAEAH